jgi:hypothetical protein
MVPRGGRRVQTRRIAAVAFGVVLIGLALLILMPRSFTPDATDLGDELTERPGHRWATGTFGGVGVVDSAIATVTIDDRDLNVQPTFVIQRALMRRPVFRLHAELQLLDLPDLEGWNDYSGSTAWFEVSEESGAVSRLLVVEEPR